MVSSSHTTEDPSTPDFSAHYRSEKCFDNLALYDADRVICVGNAFYTTFLSTELIEGVFAHELHHAKKNRSCRPLDAIFSYAARLLAPETPINRISKKLWVLAPFFYRGIAQEFEADRASIRVTGHNGIIQMLDCLDKYKPEKCTTTTAGDYWPTHPSRGERIKQAERLLTRQR
jgi:predicted Zn-dependent protease